jgi:hypothetical protein
MTTNLQGAIDTTSFERQFPQLRRDSWLFPGAVSNDFVAPATAAIAYDRAHNYDRTPNKPVRTGT